MSEPTKKAQEDLLENFQAYLHLVINAEQKRERGIIPAGPDADGLAYCARMAKLPGNPLAHELSRPVLAIIYHIVGACFFFEDCAKKTVEDPAKRQEYENILEQLDLAFGFINRHFASLSRGRAQATKNADLLFDTAVEEIGDVEKALGLIRHCQKIFPGDGRNKDGSLEPENIPSRFVRETFKRVESLDSFIEEFPEHARAAARELPGWPIIARRHTNTEKWFQELAGRLELGEDFPLNASAAATFRPDTPMVKYVERLVCRVESVRSLGWEVEFTSVEDERERVRSWLHWENLPRGDDVVEVARAFPRLPPLTKATARDWARKALVPYILVTDARDWTKCVVPALRGIAGQKNPKKSGAIFKSRLLAAVSATLKRLSRPVE